MTDQAGSFGDMAMNLHNQAGVLATVETVLELAVEALHYDYASVMPMHRKRPETINPSEVAAAIVYLASPEAEFATGTVLDFNGGSYLRM